ncbi:MAG: cysteine-rich small domain-containing protein [Blautia sp.]|uniref:cysteine-rich small domain-containing protein n=1 Tax=Blautia sp. TaxID=1955243 RepID=UPI002589F8A1|nr:cysteine-rich small domain-containing protein [Blautia sp.]MCI7289199.1 cysteine-rich small domain-containing protein [Blautia sp.]
MEKPYWEGKHYAFFSNKECEYFPCHAGADPENFNCLFCYCPLYALGDKCGGNFRMTEKGIKDCTNCQLPHKAQNYGYVTGKYSELAELMKKIREEKDGL